MEVNFQLYPCLWRYNQKVIFIIYSLVNGIFGTEGYGGRRGKWRRERWLEYTNLSPSIQSPNIQLISSYLNTLDLEGFNQAQMGESLSC